jgi:YggT family protein
VKSAAFPDDLRRASLVWAGWNRYLTGAIPHDAQPPQLAQVLLMIRLLDFIDWLLGLYEFILIVTAIMSWLIAFSVINVRNDLVRQVLYTLDLLTEPALRPIRRFVPPLGGLDLSFLVLFILIELIRRVIIPDLQDLLGPPVLIR